MNTSLVPFGTRFGLLDDFRKEVDQMMSRFFHGSDTPGMAQWTPRVNVAETDQSYEVTVDLPGLKLEEIDVELRHGDLWVTGQRQEQHEEQGKTWHRVERHYGQFRRVVRLGDDVNPEHVDAEYKDGVLNVSVAKSEQARTKKIEVKG
jgi:HSP20 family protein